MNASDLLAIVASGEISGVEFKRDDVRRLSTGKTTARTRRREVNMILMLPSAPVSGLRGRLLSVRFNISKGDSHV
jgi:hypothetical protein